MFLDNTTVRIFLGSALILQAGAMLRYVSFFKELNVRMIYTVVLLKRVKCLHVHTLKLTLLFFTGSDKDSWLGLPTATQVSHLHLHAVPGICAVWDGGVWLL